MSHTHPGLVAVAAGPIDMQGLRSFSSGLLVAPRLVLTSGHGLTASKEASHPHLDIQLITGSRGSMRIRTVRGRIAWLGTANLDAALVELSEEQDVPGFAPELVWGEPIGTRPLPVEMTGMPRFAASGTGEGAEVEVARGSLEPGTYTSSDRYAVNLSAGWPGGWKDWAGMSGAAVMSADGGLLVGVVGWSDPMLEGRRLTAVPASALLTNAQFRDVIARHLGSVPEIEPVELAPYLSQPRAPASLGGLLRADAALMEFVGRDSEIGLLQQWRDQPPTSGPNVKVMLVTGRGGEGKTRLAAEFVARSRKDGWIGGLLRAGALTGLAPVAAHSARRLLLVVDYAAERAAEIAALVQAVMQARPRLPVRVLLLARAGGQWWRDLAVELEGELPELEGEVLELRPLLAADRAAARRPDPAAVFTEAVRSFAPYLASFTGYTPAELRQMAMQVQVPDLSRKAFEHALTVQLAALVALLQQSDRVVTRGAGLEDTLLKHEQKYRDRLARERGLDDLRSVRDRAVAGAALVGARGSSLVAARDAACAVAEAALAPDLTGHTARQRDVAAWIAEVYPPDDPGPDDMTEYWGLVLPDRIGEFMVARLLADEVTTGDGHEDMTGSGKQGLLESLAGCSDGIGAMRALLILSRATEHDARAANWIEKLVCVSPELYGVAAPLVAVYAENPGPLRSAMVKLGTTNSNILHEVASVIEDALPRFSLKAMNKSAGLTRELTVIYRELTGFNRDAWLPYLALKLSNYSVRLGQIGRLAEAVTVSEEAVALERELVAENRDVHLPFLASSLNNHALALAQIGQEAAALLVSEETVTLSRQLAATDHDAFRHKLANALDNHAARLAEAGRHAQAFSASEEAVALYRELAVANRDTFLPDLTISLNNQTAWLDAMGRHAQALQVSDEVLSLRRELTATNRDAFLPDLTVSLRNHALQLAHSGRGDEAFHVSEEAIALDRELAAVNRDAFLSGLADSLYNHSSRLAEMGQPDQALQTSEEAVALYRELAAVNRGAFLKSLARSLGDRSVRLAELGQKEEAVLLSEEAIALGRELAAVNRDAHLSELAVSLNNCAAWLAELGRPSEALPLSKEAVTLHRELAAANRDVFLPGLAASLKNHSKRLAELGHPSEALPPSQEAVALYRELTATEHTYVSGLAVSLFHYANQLAETDQLPEALRVSQEAVALYRELAADDPDGYLPDLATLLNDHAVRLMTTGQLKEALPVLQEAISLYRERTVTDRDAYLSRLATLLKNLAGLLSKMGQLGEAMPVSQETVALYSELAAADPDSYLTDLADSMSRQAFWLTQLGRLGEAVSISQDAVIVYQKLAASDRNAHLPNLANAVRNHAVWLAQIGQNSQAFQVSEMAVALERELAATSRDAYLSGLASALNNHAGRLAELGQRAEAVPVSAEAVTLYRELASANRDAHLPDLAGSLRNYVARLAEAQQWVEAVPVSAEAVALDSELADANRNAYLPDLAISLLNRTAVLVNAEQWIEADSASAETVIVYRELAASGEAHLPGLATSLENRSAVVTEVGRRAEAVPMSDHVSAVPRHRHAALTLAREAVDILRQCAETNPDAYLNRLTTSLNSLSNRLTEADKSDKVANVWESAIAGMPGQASQSALTVAYASYLIRRTDVDAGTELLAKTIATAETPGPVETAARQLLRSQWRKNAPSVERAWQATTPAPLPDWIHLNDDDFTTVAQWINTSSWTESLSYFQNHADRLLASSTTTALAELALTNTEGLIEQHRTLLDAAREHGLEAAYEPLLLTETLATWMQASDLNASRQYLSDHLELLSEDVPEILENLGSGRDQQIAVHQALLILVKATGSVQEAYDCLTNEQALKLAANRAITVGNIAQVEACAAVEAFVHRHALTSWLYASLAKLLTDPAARLPDGFTNQLRDLASQADMSEQEAVTAEFEAAVTQFPIDAHAADELRRALRGSGDTQA